MLCSNDTEIHIFLSKQGSRAPNQLLALTLLFSATKQSLARVFSLNVIHQAFTLRRYLQNESVVAVRGPRRTGRSASTSKPLPPRPLRSPPMVRRGKG